MKEALIDTDILSYFLQGREKVVNKVSEYLKTFDCLQISIITYYEIKSGLIYKDAQKQLKNFELFAEENSILPLSPKTVDISANIYANLRQAGQLIGHTDTLIAGIALTNNLVLITNNTQHFARIPNLILDNWLL